jgi:hypothetical protein
MEKDIVERLRSGGAYSGGEDEKLMDEAANEIERLRSLLGVVSPGHSVSEIKEMLRTPEGIAKLKANYETLLK